MFSLSVISGRVLDLSFAAIAFLAIVLACASAGTVPSEAPSVQVDPALPVYTQASGVAGRLKSVGSDTMNNLMTLWLEEFKRNYPNVATEIEGKGSSEAPPALIQGISQFGPMSRAMKKGEIDEFEAKFKYKPHQIRVGIDGLAVFVHKDAPIDSITLDQVRQIFSVEGKDMTWGDLGVTDAAWANKPIGTYGRNSASGTYGFFKEVALGNKDYKPTVKEQPGSSAVVQAVATDRYSMGYSGVGYRTADVKALSLSKSKGEPAFEPTQENCYSGDYPLARFLYVYANRDPSKRMEPLREEFVKLVLSKQGQELAIKDGYIPLPANVAREELERLGIEPNF